jgi:uncharacterized protein YneF (UPF0154 family)
MNEATLVWIILGLGVVAFFVGYFLSKYQQKKEVKK